MAISLCPGVLSAYETHTLSMPGITLYGNVTHLWLGLGHIPRYNQVSRFVLRLDLYGINAFTRKV